MSEETKTAVESGTEQQKSAEAQPAAPSPEPITKDKIVEFRKKGDKDSIRKFIESASKPKDAQPAQATSEAVATVSGSEQPENSQKPVNTADVKKFVTKYRGQEVSEDDSDGFLGRKSAEELKKEIVHKRFYVQDLERQEQEARAFAQQKSSEAADLERRYREAEEKLAKLSKPVASPAPTEAKPVAQAANIVVERPKSPALPQKDYDPLDDESIAEWRKYWKEDANYKAKMEEYLSNYKPEVKYDIPEEFKNEHNSLKQKVTEYDSYFAEVKLAKEREKQEQAQKKIWDERAEFQKQHKDYSTEKPINKIHDEFLSWSDRLADINGLKRPYKPFDLNDKEWYDYEKSRTELTSKYLQGDKVVVEKAHGFDPPDGYQQYLGIVELEAKRKMFVDEGVLGQKASLHDAFVKDFDKSGKMGEALSNIERESILKGASNVKKALDGNSQYATQLPQDITQRRVDVSAEVQMTKAERDKLLHMYARELRVASPEVLKRRKTALYGK